MNLVCAHTGPHDGSVSVLNDGELFHYIEERFCNTKHAGEVLYGLLEVSKNCRRIDNLSFSNLFYHLYDFGVYSSILYGLLKVSVPGQADVMIHYEHHYLHAKTSFCHSGFENAVVVVIDGAGTTFNYGKENLTIFDMTKSDGKSLGESKHLYKSVVGSGSTITCDTPDYVDKNTRIGPGFSYTAVTEALGFGGLDCGKTMGMSAYGKDDKSIPKLLSIDSSGNDTFKLKEPIILGNNFEGSKYLKVNDLGSCGSELRRTKFTNKEDLAYRIQLDYEEYLIETCKKALKLSKYKNLVLTGGCALNCVANYKLLKSLPEDVTLYADPTCDDSSVSIGGVYHVHHLVDPQKDFTLKNLYKGRQMTYNFEYEDQYQVTPKDIAELLDMGKVIAIAQGRSEIGPRALGNRSILFDPRVKDGKDIINRIKKREKFRPFAGTVLQEHAKEWFDMDRLDESPFMMYAVDVLPEKIEQIPSIVHVDGTCRVQTVTEEQNKNYYDVISEFHKITGVPILFNTSFNLAGDTMVDTIEDALCTLHNSEIEYLYLPEISTLVRVAND